jgi:hypothetical protein
MLRRLSIVIGALTALAAAPAAAENVLDEVDRLLKGDQAAPAERKGASPPETILKGGSGSRSGLSSLSNAEIDLGLREALRVGTGRVVGTLGRLDGFNLSDVHIPLPGVLGRAQKALRAVGQSELVDDLELRLNRAAEIATPLAKGLFVDAIEDMTLTDVRDILTGPEDSATRYFCGRMSKPLALGMRPIVDDALADAGAVKAYDRMMGSYRTLPLVPDVKADLTAYVLEKGIDGIFLYLGREEAAIRKDPLKRTSAILRKVFGAL